MEVGSLCRRILNCIEEFDIRFIADPIYGLSNLDESDVKREETWGPDTDKYWGIYVCLWRSHPTFKSEVKPLASPLQPPGNLHKPYTCSKYHSILVLNGPKEQKMWCLTVEGSKQRPALCVVLTFSHSYREGGVMHFLAF